MLEYIRELIHKNNGDYQNDVYNQDLTQDLNGDNRNIDRLKDIFS